MQITNFNLCYSFSHAHHALPLSVHRAKVFISFIFLYPCVTQSNLFLEKKNEIKKKKIYSQVAFFSVSDETETVVIFNVEQMDYIFLPFFCLLNVKIWSFCCCLVSRNRFVIFSSSHTESCFWAPQRCLGAHPALLCSALPRVLLDGRSATIFHFDAPISCVCVCMCVPQFRSEQEGDFPFFLNPTKTKRRMTRWRRRAISFKKGKRVK